jgi:hypothetical protein
MTDSPPLLYPGPRAALLRRVRALAPDDLRALDAAVRTLAAEKAGRNVDKGFFYAWWDGPRLPSDAERELDDLFADMLIALAGGLTGLDVERFGSQLAPKRGGLDAFFSRFLRPRQSRQLQDASIGLIEGAVAPWDPRLAIVATWNMICAVALRDHLPPPTADRLGAAWRRALGDLPA